MQVGQKKWLVLGTGGTIAGTSNRANDHTGYTAGQVTVENLLEGAPGVKELLTGDQLICEQVAQLDSKDMDHATWQRLALRVQAGLTQADVAGVVVTHGTDTAEETAWFLQSVLDGSKPVVLTCAMRPATASFSDGPQNLLDALTVVRDPNAQGVLLVCAGRIHSARAVQKVHPYRLDAFSSGDAGPLGWIEQGQVRWASASRDSMEALQAHPHAHQLLQKPAEQWPWVAVLHSRAGARAQEVQALVEAGVQGLVIAGTGNGTVHAEWLSAVQTMEFQGVALRLCSRCAEGRLVGVFSTLPPAPLGLNPYKARISLMLDLLGQP